MWWWFAVVAGGGDGGDCWWSWRRQRSKCTCTCKAEKAEQTDVHRRHAHAHMREALCARVSAVRGRARRAVCHPLRPSRARCARVHAPSAAAHPESFSIRLLGTGTTAAIACAYADGRKHASTHATCMHARTHATHTRTRTHAHAPTHLHAHVRSHMRAHARTPTPTHTWVCWCRRST